MGGGRGHLQTPQHGQGGAEKHVQTLKRKKKKVWFFFRLFFSFEKKKSFVSLPLTCGWHLSNTILGAVLFHNGMWDRKHGGQHIHDSRQRKKKKTRLKRTSMVRAPLDFNSPNHFPAPWGPKGHLPLPTGWGESAKSRGKLNVDAFFTPYAHRK